MSCTEILKAILDSDDFTVGGGSAAALTGGMAAALAAMVAKLSLKKDFGLTHEEYSEIASRAGELSASLVEGSENDVQAFAMVKAAYAMPKGTQDEKKERAAAIEQAFIQAALVPKYNAWNCHKVWELCTRLAGRSNPNASSDLETARSLARAAMIGCLLNIEINLDSIKNEDVKNQLQEDIKKLRDLVRASE
ncbi:MAG: cyclodeaminase/cyclohydrolase family protein [Bacillota bacterium]